MSIKEQVSSGDKALAACRAQVAAAVEVKRLTQAIADGVGACFEAWDEASHNQAGASYKSHLESAYAFEIGGWADDEYRVYLDDAAQLEILAACPHCLAAHNAIQERKSARRRLAAARRAITMIGKTA